MIPRRWLHESGFLLWFAALAGIGAWIVHITLVSAMTRFTCTERDVEWVLHAGTLVTAGITAAAVAMCLMAMRAADDPDDAATVPGNIRFLGIFGLLTGIISLALILLEGSYIFFLNPCA